MCFRLVWGFSLFQVAILLTCALMPGSPFCRGQWLWKSQTCTKKKGVGYPDFVEKMRLGDQIILILQKLEMWNRNCLYKKICLCTSGFPGETGRPRFFHIIPLQNGSLYFWWFSFFQVAILLKCVLMSGSPLCRGSGSENHKSAPKKGGWVPWFCREDALLDLWQVPHSVEVRQAIFLTA